jgi:hypothetical protein
MCVMFHVGCSLRNRLHVFWLSGCSLCPRWVGKGNRVECIYFNLLLRCLALRLWREWYPEYNVHVSCIISFAATKDVLLLGGGVVGCHYTQCICWLVFYVNMGWVVLACVQLGCWWQASMVTCHNGLRRTTRFPNLMECGVAHHYMQYVHMFIVNIVAVLT